MQVSLRKIGNSRGIIIPSAIIDQLNIGQKVEMSVQEGALVLKPFNSPREGWFEGYDEQKDFDPLAEMKEIDTEQKDWEW